MYYKHFFQCAACKAHLIYKTDVEMPSAPGRTHWQALEGGAEPPARNSPVGPTCMGVITYCAGFDKFGKPCGGNHPRGTEKYENPPPPAPNPDWDHFAGLVNATWLLYVNSGYSMALRGPNHDRAYKPPPKVTMVLQQSGGMVTINGGLYVTSNSLTSDASLKRSAGGHATFIYHL